MPNNSDIEKFLATKTRWCESLRMRLTTSGCESIRQRPTTYYDGGVIEMPRQCQDCPGPDFTTIMSASVKAKAPGAASIPNPQPKERPMPTVPEHQQAQAPEPAPQTTQTYTRQELGKLLGYGTKNIADTHRMFTTSGKSTRGLTGEIQSAMDARNISWDQVVVSKYAKEAAPKKAKTTPAKTPQPQVQAMPEPCPLPAQAPKEVVLAIPKQQYSVPTGESVTINGPKNNKTIAPDLSTIPFNELLAEVSRRSARLSEASKLLANL